MKLTLNKETLRILDAGQLSRIRGGGGDDDPDLPVYLPETKGKETNEGYSCVVCDQTEP